MKCPECGAGEEEIVVYEMTAYKLATGEFLYHSQKIQDQDARCRCDKCNWSGKQSDLEQ